ncbi:macro domain-containing protein [Ancylomarina longa]|uniref:Thoeris protein ThsA Macro domain-containing protein n=1 Tax=Ancylomarina longa TaxID=2487017 RepID=A0A434AEU2_9BACT|nr:macro domain-containing protein [Ancylomarina longa]RUT72852.1 hypothetical protein DLK05_16335 [Ancylomarina longa]
MKVKLFDKKLLKNYLVVLSVISLFCSFAFIAVKIPDDNCIRIWVGIILVAVLLIVYLAMWIMANNQNKTTLNINSSTMIIKTGDVFEEDGLKVIAFNEYFDTLVDNRIIAENTLNGKYIKEKIDNLTEFDEKLDTDSRLNKRVLEENESRSAGKKKRYKLGTIYEHNDYLLTAFTRFDEDNRAFLNMDDYINFLLNFWNEIDIIYAGRSVSIPLLGSGITRFKGYDTISEQELIELLIWSFKVSRTKFTYPSKVSIIVHESKKDKINFYKLNKD